MPAGSPVNPLPGGMKEPATAASLENLDMHALMNAEGPIVKCVVLKSDGTTEEQTVDMVRTIYECSKPTDR
jgi:hypothetical protein